MSPVEPRAAERLARHCDPAGLGFSTTAELSDVTEIVGQARAVAGVVHAGEHGHPEPDAPAHPDRRPGWRYRAPTLPPTDGIPASAEPSASGLQMSLMVLAALAAVVLVTLPTGPLSRRRDR